MDDCEICGLKKSKSYKDKRFCYWCDLTYSSLFTVIRGVISQYHPRAENRIPNNEQVIVERLLEYLKKRGKTSN